MSDDLTKIEWANPGEERPTFTWLKPSQRTLKPYRGPPYEYTPTFVTHFGSRKKEADEGAGWETDPNPDEH